jgi:CheY-like chemotaxis protein/HPt (histidine-containing phosphotransfer) domain-containing protein
MHRVTSLLRRDGSLSHSLTAIGVVTSAASLLVACAVLLVYDFAQSRARFVDDVTVLAAVLADNSTASLTFGDQAAGNAILAAVAVNRQVTRAEILKPAGDLFAWFDRAHGAAQPLAVAPSALRRGEPWHAFIGGRLLVLHPIVLNNERIGSVVVETTLADLQHRAFRFVRAVVVGDPVRFQQVISNVASNAVKFTERGDVRVHVACDARVDGAVRLHVQVQDSGIGIPRDKQAAIFEAFRQADGSTTRRFGGTGLGLTISANLAHLMGGRLWAGGGPGVGSTFHFTTSFDVPDQQAVPDRDGAVDTRPAAACLRVLLVEDHRVNQEVAVGLLARRGHHVTVADTGRAALTALEHDCFDVVLMDLQMPEMGGIEATLEIRRRERATGGHVRIIAITAHTMAGDRERCLEAGMDGYVAKPFEPRLLFAAMEDADARPAVPPPPAPGTVVFDRAGLVRRVRGDRTLMMHVIEIFLEDCPKRRAEMQAAIDVRDASAVRPAAHALKGAAANLGAPTLAEAAATLERVGAESRMDAAQSAWRGVSVEATRIVGLLRQLPETEPREPSVCVQ